VTKISGFTYVRNGFTFGYPFLASIKSLLPIVDELVVVVGDSHDGTREAVERIGDRKLKIVDTVWDEESRKSGKVFAEQSNLALSHATGKWCFHLQVDEVLHESAKNIIIEAIELADENVDGLILPFLHFWGDYNHIRNTRKTHKYETRLFKSNRNIFSYRDSQGFRKYSSKQGFENGEKGIKLNVLKVDTPVYHYSATRNPKLMKKKANYFHRFWHSDTWINEKTDNEEFDYNTVDKLELFINEHPLFMKEIINEKDWDFNYDPSKSNMSFRDKLLNKFEQLTNYRLFAYQNYNLIKGFSKKK
jgi:glycosyltransferase involved in cell wall biosynthesis